MKRRISVLFILLLTITAVSFADETWRVKLDNDNNKAEKEFRNRCFKIYLQLYDSGDGTARVDVAIENTDDKKGLLIFDKAYSEDELKKMPLKIKYDKSYLGNKEKTEKIDGIYDIFHLDSQEKEWLCTINVNSGETGQLEIPVYIVDYKNGKILFWEKKEKELLISDLNKVNLKIEVELKQEQEQEKVDPNIVSEYNKLKAEYDTVVFCTNENHEPSCEEQMEKFQERIDSLKNKIEEIKDRMYSSESLYEEYDTLKNKLDSLDLSQKEGYCDMHKPKHRVYEEYHECRFCRYDSADKLSADELYIMMEKIYKKIYNRPDRITKEDSLYKDAVTISNCISVRSYSDREKYKHKILKLKKDIEERFIK